LRPRYASGRGAVSGPLSTREEVATAFETALKDGWSALVEKFVPGNNVHLLVIGERVVSGLRERKDVTGQLHPDVVARVADAVRVVGLDVAGVEITTPDVKQPLEGRGVVVSVQGQPDLTRHLEAGRPVGEAIVGQLYPEGQTGRIPVIGVTGTNGKTTTTRLTAHIIGQAHQPVGMACTEGIYVGSRRVVDGDCSGPWSARCVLQNAGVEAAVLETARGGILREGLGFDRCDVAIVTNIGEGDHLGASDIDTPAQLAWVKSTLVAAVAPTGTAVLNATDPLVADMAKYCRGSVVWFAPNGTHPQILKHRSEQGRAVFVRDHHIVLAAGEKETTLVSLDRVPLTRKGRIGFHVENALAAAAAAWAVGVPVADIRTGLETFTPSMDLVPARFNVLDVHGITVVLDYGHNVSALARLIEALEQLPHKWRTIVYSAAGDRRDSDMVDQGELLGRAFDRVILYEDTYLRGRQEGEISDLFRKGLSKGERVSEIESIKGGLPAVETALAASRPGDLLVIQPDLIDDAVEYLKRLVEAGAREISLDEALALPEKVLADAARGVEVRVGRLGHSVYASKAFERGDVMLNAWGPYTETRSRHSIQVDEDRHIIPGTPLRFFNHSCEPNCGLVIRCGVEQIEVHALRPIQPGDELTLDYNTFEAEVEFIAGPCLCTSQNCRGGVRGYKHLPHKLRSAYGIYIAEYLRIAETPVVTETPAPAKKRAVLGAVPTGS
jgi:cyanophycin synthetase